MAETLSQQRAARALRHFSLSGAFWAVYGPNATVTGSVFTGFALAIGIRESQIAFLAALTGLVGASQVLSFYWTRRVADKRRFAWQLGVFEITFASLPIVIGPLVPPSVRFLVVAALLFAAYAVGHTVGPIFASWMANVIPAEVRATYTARRLFLTTAVSAGYLLVASQWLDLAHGPLRFPVVYAVGWVAGILGYILLALTPFPPMVVEPPAGYGRSLLEPFRDRAFALLVAFTGFWTLAMSVAGPFYAVYMLNYLHLSYTRIAVYSNLSLLAMLAGYRLAGPLAQRFGCRPIVRILIVPALFVPLLWAVATGRTWPFLVPAACLISGVAVSGLQVAGSALIYRIVPPGRENSAYFAAMTGVSAVGAFVGALGAGFVKNALGTATVHLWFLELSPPQVVFLLSAGIYLIPLVLARWLGEPEAEPATRVLGQFRGNLASLAFNYVIFSLAKESHTRASAIRGMAKSRSPLAVAKLSESLDDVSPEVRQEAALGLGETHALDAIPQLLQCLADPNSDIRAEAAMALGQIGSAEAIEPLREALADPDSRVRCSAALALGEIGGPTARALLIGALEEPADAATFPSLVAAAGRTGDLRVVDLALAHLMELDSPVLRMQVINGVCRALGEPGHFYKLFSRRGLDRLEMTEGMMRRIVRLVSRAHGLSPEDRAELHDLAQSVADAVAADRFGEMAAHAKAVADRVTALPSAPDMAQAAARAIRVYVDEAAPGDLGGEGVVFLVIALTSLARSLAQRPREASRPATRRPTG